MKRFFLLSLLALLPLLPAQEAPQPQAELLRGAEDTWNLRWWGVPGRSYFLQASDDLASWHFAPVIEGGNDEIIEYETGSLGQKYFVRLIHTDQTAADPDTADFDGDGLGNLAEITLHHTHPLEADSDGDGLPDKWEIDNGLDPNDDGSVNPVNGAGGDGDGDGSPNSEELAGETDPGSDQDFPPRMYHALRQIVQNYSDPSGTLRKYATWHEAPVPDETTSAALSPGSMDQALSALAFPATPPASAAAEPIEGAMMSASANHSDISGGSVAHGHLQHARLWLRASPSDIARGKTKRKFLKVTDRYVGPYQGPHAHQTPEVSVEEFEVNPATGLSEPVDLKPVVTPSTGDYFSSAFTYIRAVEIVPAEGMVGVVGDMIPSNRTVDPELHFVTPKETAEIPQDHVVFKVKGLTPEQIEPGNPDQIVEWEGGEAVPDEPLKRRVKRDQAAKTEVKIKTLQAHGADEVAKVNVWVVWCGITAKPGTPQFYISDDDWSKYLIKHTVEEGWRFLFKVHPEDVIVAEERPALHGYRKKNVPGFGKMSYTMPTQHADSANYKWDVSRQFKEVIRNPSLISRASLEVVGMDWAFVNQPKIFDVPVSFPQEDTEGNDDSPILDEEANPYEASEILSLEHGLGELSSYDAPGTWIPDSLGVENREFAIETDFREFARVELWNGKRSGGKFWFRVSDFHKWHHAARFRFIAGSGDWANNGSSSGNGHVNP